VSALGAGVLVGLTALLLGWLDTRRHRTPKSARPSGGIPLDGDEDWRTP
jgi:hypothetical protein